MIAVDPTIATHTAGCPDVRPGIMNPNSTTPETTSPSNPKKPLRPADDQHRHHEQDGEDRQHRDPVDRDQRPPPGHAFGRADLGHVDAVAGLQTAPRGHSHQFHVHDFARAAVERYGPGGDFWEPPAARAGPIPCDPVPLPGCTPDPDPDPTPTPSPTPPPPPDRAVSWEPSSASRRCC